MNIGMFPNGTDQAAAAVAMARFAGCTCNVEAEVAPVPDASGLRHVAVRHDDWCPTARTRRAPQLRGDAMLTIRSTDDRSDAGWCLGVGRDPHWTDELTREPRNSGPALCPTCLRTHRARSEVRPR
jgi:hypothetical protein